ncbi:hypothetical protein I350_00178 [Cryptococcus amylolentus CBS 6273]|uniref:Autophagy-related protein 2 n=1 Tax=Cryptococcus amylolentus CBS 6273 TaxID=1296118 RepID=A0A1E3KE80_9TREE|nr:hypothetical protein I350_00178 [Cryptococcus amylolentus CBS 6273]
MFSLPSFITSIPFALPSLPSISLPANIQRRFLSYVLKRTLGRFVLHQALDAERIQAQVSAGQVELEELQVDSAEINSYIPPNVPLTLTSGSLGRLTARLPFPNLWSDPLSVSLDTLTLDFTLACPSPLSHGKASSHPAADHHDLAESVTSAADDFLHHELDAYEEKELEGSIRQSLILSQTDPFESDLPGGFPSSLPTGHISPGQPLPADIESTTVLAGMVERILARLDLKVENVVIRVKIEGEEEGVVELRIRKVQYADESEAQLAEGCTTRSIRISGVDIVSVPSFPPPSSPRVSRQQPRTSSVSSGSSKASSSDDDSADMYMSQAVADLREGLADVRLSPMESSSSSEDEPSVYESALFHSAIEEQPGLSGIPNMPPAGSSSSDTEDEGSRSATPTPEAKSQPRSPLPATPILSFGQEDIVLRMRTTRPSPLLNEAAPQSALPKVDVEVLVGTVAAVILPSQLRLLICALQSLSQTEPSTEEPLSTTKSQPRMTVINRIKFFQLIAVYDLSAPQSPQLFKALDTHFARPASSLPFNHLRFKLEQLEAIYTSQGQAGPRPVCAMSSAPAAAGLRRRSSAHARFGPAPTSLSVTVQDMSLLEHFIPRDSASEEGVALPIVLFDPGLARQYDLPTLRARQSAMPEFESMDWRAPRRSGVERQWKVRQRGRGILKDAKKVEEGPVVVLEKDSGAAVVTLLPVHVFLDLSLVERLLPLLRATTPLIHKTEPAPPSYPALNQEVTPESIISSLSAPSPSKSSNTKAEIRCSMLRLDVRCPEPPPEGVEREAWSEGSGLRSGIFSVDVHGLGVKLLHGRDNGHQGKEVAKVEFESTLFFFAPAGQRNACAFLALSPLTPDPDEDDVPLLPSVSVSTVASSPLTDASSPKTTLVTCKIPAIHSSLHRSLVVGLQYFADDTTRWLDGTFSDGSARPRDELKMIGSRFFGGSKGSEASSEVEEEEEGKGAGLRVAVEINEVDVGLFVPRLEDGGGERMFSLKASDLDVRMETNPVKNETALTVSVMDLDFSDVSSETSRRILGRTTPFTLTSHQAPIVYIRFVSSTDRLTTMKESNISLTLSHFTFAIHKEIIWLHELLAFIKPPEGVFENLSPTDVTKLSVSLSSASVLLVPPNVPGSIVIIAREVEGWTEMRRGAEENPIHVGIGGMGALAIEGDSGPLEVAGSLSDIWKKAGHAQLIEVTVLELQLLRRMAELGETSLDITDAQFKVTACADSLASFGELATDFGKLFPNEKLVPIKSPALQESINVFGELTFFDKLHLCSNASLTGSLDEDAFNVVPEIVSHADADMIDDDLPQNLDYLDHATRVPKHKPSLDSSTGESLRTWESTGAHGEDDHWGHGEEAETVRVFAGKVQEEQGYWEGLPVLNNGFSADELPGKTRVRVHRASLKLMLYDGYDWSRTRKVIEDEVRAVRRRLERIRQLLASGQKADESIERAASSVLFNSVYVGLDPQKASDMNLSGMGMGKMDDKALLAAIDEELDDMETESQSSWQTLPAGVGAGAGVVHHAKKVKLKGKRLTRSKKPQIEITVSDIKADVDLYGPGEATSSRVHFTAKELEILDHIKTSTWKKFLTELKSDNRGNIRETDADMLRLELVGVRLQEGEEELRLRLKILPLRLHVDQDALDFLKRFFSFKAPSLASQQPPNPSPASPTNPSPHPSSGPYFQHVEIYPIQLKLDYKPKRVDYKALREGKTIELMNFFHFEGAEMTLRHVTLSGISGLERLGTTLQDLWTPDVKANQLADVISGVSPIRSMVNVGSGVADLILLPIEQYRKDGRIAKGVQRGTNSFVKSTALEMMKLGARLATGTQVVLERAEGMLGGQAGEEVIAQSLPMDDDFGIDSGLLGTGSSSEDESEMVSRYASQPENAREGVQAAYASLSKNVNAAAQTILAVPMEVYERSGDDGPLKAVVRAVPIAVLKPMIGTTEAVSKTLLGMRNSLDPSARRELGDKYK